MFVNNSIQLRGDLGKVPIQIKCADADAITAHAITGIGLERLVGRRVEQHTGHSVRLVAKCRVLVLDVCENLIQIVRVERIRIILGLQRARIVLGVNYKYIAALSSIMSLCITGSSVSAPSSRLHGMRAAVAVTCGHSFA